MTKKTALILMFIILGGLVLFHLLIFTQVLPFDEVWAGKLNSVEEMKRFELLSILISLFMLGVLIIKYKLLASARSNKLIDVLIWIFTAFFALNTLGNFFAESIREAILGGLFTLISAVLCFIIVRKEKG